MKDLDTTVILGGVASVTTAAATLFGLALKPTRDAINQQNRTIADLRKDLDRARERLEQRAADKDALHQRILDLSVELSGAVARAEAAEKSLTSANLKIEKQSLKIIELRQKETPP